MQRFLVTGASGNVGRYVVRGLLERGAVVRAAARPRSNAAAQPGSQSAAGYPRHPACERVGFDFGDATTWGPALAGVDGVFLMRPPHISNIKRDMLPFLGFLRDYSGVHTVFMSVQGAESNPWVPHHKLEQYLQQLEIAHSLLRPSFFMENLTTTHLPEIRDEQQLYVPAGSGRTNFIAGEDIAACAVEVLLQPQLQNAAYTVTGPHSYSYQEVAEYLSTVLQRPIRYANPGPLRFLRYHWGKRSFGMSLVMLALYSIVRFGKGDITTTDTERILGREPQHLDEFLREHRALFNGDD